MNPQVDESGRVRELRHSGATADDMEGESVSGDIEGESVWGRLPANAMWNTGPVSVWSVDALDRFACWMTYARLFEHVDLLGAWVDSAEQFSLVLWDRRAEVPLGCTVSASEWADPAGQSPERILAQVVARTRSASSGPKDAVGIVWDRESELRRLPWDVLPRPE